MEFEVRVVGGIESCFVSLPLSLIQTLQSGYLPPILAIELLGHTPLARLIARQYADCIELSDRTVVRVRLVSNLPEATLVAVEPLTEDDWEILELNSELAENAILKQVGIVHDQMKFPLWLHGQTVVMFLVISTFPQEPVVQLVPGTDVAVAPKRRKNPSIQSQEESHKIPKAQLRVQDSDSTFIYKCEENGVRMDVMFTSGAFIHPETAKKYSLNSLQFVVISPRFPSKESKKRLHSRSESSEKDTKNGNLTDKQDRHQIVVCLLLSESVTKGHIMLSQSLRLYLGVELHSFSISPYHFKMSQKNEVIESSSLENGDNLENHKRKDELQRKLNGEDWSVHEKIVAALSSGSLIDVAEETATKTGETHTKFGYKNGLPSLLRAWFWAQLDTVVSNSEEDVSSLVIGSKTLLHFKVKNHRLPRNGKVQTSSNRFPKNRNQDEEPSVDVLYVLSLSEESQHDKDINAYELAFDGSANYTSRSLDMLLGKLQLGDILFSYAAGEPPRDNAVAAAFSSLDWMGAAPLDVNYKCFWQLLGAGDGLKPKKVKTFITLLGLTTLSPSSYDLPLPGHILICGPPGSGKTLLAKVSAKYLEGCKEILAHMVFVSCSRLTLEKPPTIRQALSNYISEALDHAPSVIVLDDLDSLIAPSSDLEGSQPSSSSAALIEFLADILDEYEARLLCSPIFFLSVDHTFPQSLWSKAIPIDGHDRQRNFCGIGPIAFIATAQSLTSFPQSLSSSGRFDFHVNLPIPAATERSAMLKHEIQKRSLQCSDDLLSDIASKCDGYDAYDLEILVDRSVHAAIGRTLSADLGSGENEKPTLVRDDFLQAMQNFLPVAMRDITKPAAEGGRSGWEDVGGLNEIRNAIKEMIELPSKFPIIFAQAPLRMRSNVLLYGPPGCGKTHIVGAAAAACSLRFISVKGPELLNKYIGASEQAVRDIFSKAAAAAPCLLFFDEFDSIAPKRGHDNTGVTDRVVNQFLTELDGVEVLTGVFVLPLQGSRPDLLDAALLRPGRLDRLLFCDFPSQQERLDILKVLSRKLPMASDVDLERISRMTKGFSGADLQALLSDTQLEAVHELLDREDGGGTGKMPVITVLFWSPSHPRLNRQFQKLRSEALHSNLALSSLGSSLQAHAMASSTVGSTGDALSKLQIDDLPSAAPNLRKTLALFSPQQVELAKVLLEMNQSHLFEHWPEPGVEDDEKRAFFDQVARLNASYPGGLASYIKTARELLADSKAGKNPYEGFTPSVPSGEILTFADDNFIRYEEAGVREARKAAFVLVAGGLGERLGYNGGSASSLLLEHVSYNITLNLFLPYKRPAASCNRGLMLCHDSTLAEHFSKCEGPTEIPLAIMTSDDTHSRTLELLEKNAYFGMKTSQVKLLKQAIPASLGVSATNGYHVNSLAVPRKAKEAIGGITKLTHKDGRTMVINVEYNQLDPLLRATGNPDGDVNCETGYSPFPGNINQLILEVGPYLEELSKTGGAIKEFVNPKYKDSTKTAFKSSTRLECMMQDYPKTLPPSARVGFTVPKGNPYHSATSGEMAIYRANSLILRKAGVKVDDPVQAVFNGQEVDVWPRIVWKPKWGLTFSEVKSKVKVGGSVQNAGWTIESVDFKDTSVPEEVRIRGFRINKVEQLEKAYKEPGKYSVKP
ncbi:UNVERIFIED_CONTAM: Peroxisome biogenesis protein 1 [Sesamum angustifolium]|uniref:Peroxisomal ATPase PEX1 n=1 Tax=Sesamum angustifolium TaxID=2727405 RepID=A0AAW2L5V9_9LAMI